MRIFHDGGCLDNLKCNAVIDDHFNKLQDVDQMSVPSALSLLKWNLHWMTLSGNLKCHQNLNAMENHPAPSGELLHIVVAKGVCGMRCMMGVLQSMPESGLSILWKKLSSLCIVLLILY